ncbi:Glu-tRNA(Gln) amidotransferase subunit GatD [Methanothrix sp.]|uniref:Glu-tRNA(Gln) amidotransferase subunit GatD n=1 Tax=Methanothrix sp. TaxID=90426 RepID=UPI0034E202E0
MAMELGDRVAVIKGDMRYEGILMPSRSDHVVIKLSNGYNIGLIPDRIEVLERAQKHEKPPEQIQMREDLPLVSIISTGGTIASKVDYRTGAVTSQFSAEEIISAIPELGEIARYRARVLYTILSENMRAEYWIELARAVAKEIMNGAEGVVITHGTDTMTYTAAALSFMLRTPVPVVLVGSQRSSDRPSSDAAMNAICASTVAVSDIAEVCVVMHGSTSDDYCLIHRGTRVRKMHTSRRDAFQSVNHPPIGRVDYSTRSIETFSNYRKRGECELQLLDRLEPRCALIKYFPGADPGIFDHLIESGYRGIVIEGTGLGHVASDWIPFIKKATEKDIPVVVTSQCLRGRICDRVYDTGRDMLAAGAIEAEDMLPEVALVKLMWVLENTSSLDEAREMISKPLAGEISGSTPMDV